MLIHRGDILAFGFAWTNWCFFVSCYQHFQQQYLMIYLSLMSKLCFYYVAWFSNVPSKMCQVEVVCSSKRKKMPMTASRPSACLRAFFLGKLLDPTTDWSGVGAEPITTSFVNGLVNLLQTRQRHSHWRRDQEDDFGHAVGWQGSEWLQSSRKGTDMKCTLPYPTLTSPYNYNWWLVCKSFTRRL